MRFMLLMIPKGYETAAPGTIPDDVDAVANMMKYNQSMQDAGILISCDGLHPPSMGARVSFAGGKPRVTDGPFSEAKEVLGGYWIIDVPSRAAAIEWATKCPGGENEIVEVRQIQELSDFPEDVQAVASNFETMQAQRR
ncbi:MAG: YciI family protein [Rhizobiaceae bacterium]